MAACEEANEATGHSFPVRLTGEEDSYRSSFQCCICLDLLYKPVVLACGHMSCFWCVHKAMHGLRASHCAVCRKPYIHFPSICQLLHLLIFKLEPVAYKRRESEVLEEERQLDVFSPQTDSLISEKICTDGKRSGAVRNVKDSYGNLKDSGPAPLKDFSFQQNGLKDEVLKNISVDDVLCALCKELLFQPIVLNCGHVFCEPCLAGKDSESLQCHVCESLHPGEFPNICLDLEHFLEEQFQSEYALRKEIVQRMEKVRHRCRVPSASVSTEKPDAKASICFKEGHLSLDEDFSRVHVGVGCDSCGMYPIVGKRYKCKDCKEAIGFDLCESCYNTRSKLPGRFNQQHTPDHQFELDESHMLSRIFMLASPPMEDLSEGYVSSEDPEQNDTVVSITNVNIHASDENENGYNQSSIINEEE